MVDCFHCQSITQRRVVHLSATTAQTLCILIIDPITILYGLHFFSLLPALIKKLRCSLWIFSDRNPIGSHTNTVWVIKLTHLISQMSRRNPNHEPSVRCTENIDLTALSFGELVLHEDRPIPTLVYFDSYLSFVDKCIAAVCEVDELKRRINAFDYLGLGNGCIFLLELVEEFVEMR